MSYVALGQLVGVAAPSDLTQLKRQLLLVDQIAVIHDVDPSHDWECRPENPSLAADLDWLENRGLVFRVNTAGDLEAGIEKMEMREGCVVLTPSERPGLIQFRRVAPEVIKRKRRFTYADFLDAVRGLITRIECDELRDSRGVAAVSLHSSSETLPLGARIVRGASDESIEPGYVQSVILRKLPVPGKTTSLDRILEFRDDPLSKSKILAMRRWASNLTQMNRSPSEIAQELDWLLNEYEEHMRLHEMKITRGVFETLITVTAEAAEDLVKVRWGKLAKSLFTLSNRKIELLEAELKAPGREIAYISHARKTFANWLCGD